MNKEIEVAGESGRKRYVTEKENGDLLVNWETYGRGPDSISIETNLTIQKSEFAFIKARFGLSDQTPIGEALLEISKTGKGDQFIDDLNEGTIKFIERFTF